MQPQPNPIKSFLLLVFDLFQVFIIALAIFVLIYVFVAQPHRVRGDSMEPNFHDGEYVLTEKISYYFGEPKRGDVVVFKYPKNRELDYIKRLVAMPGEIVSIRDNKVLVNGQELQEKYLATGTLTTGHDTIRNGLSFDIPESEYVVMGDNRQRSSDSREWGTVNTKDIIGRTFFRYWPLSDFGLVRE